MKKIMTGLAFAASLSGAAWAQEAPMTITRGTISSVSGQMLEAKSRNGQTVPVTMTDKTKVLVAETASLADVKPNSYVGIAAAPLPDGTIKALEVTIFDESLRGSGDGHYGWDLPGSTTMTNGAVGSVQTTNGRTMVIDYKGGSKTVVVPDDVPVVTIKPSDSTVLKPGARVVVFSPKGVASITANALVAGANGTVPPM
jgi:hypothetical protein